MKKWFICIAMLGLALAPIQAGTKEEIIRLQSDVLQLSNQILALQKSFDQKQGSSQTLLEQLIDQAATTNRMLEEIVGVLRSQKTESGTAVAQLRDEIQGLSVKLDDTNNRVAGIYQKMEENQLKIESRRIPSDAEPGGPKPDQVYSLAFNDYLAGNYELAITGFQDFLVTYPDSEYSDNAAYYLGLSYQQLGKMEQAVQAFDEVINLYPKADMTPSAYYKKGKLQLELQNTESALDAFQKLVTLFPNSQEAVIALQDLEAMGVDVSRLKRGRKN